MAYYGESYSRDPSVGPSRKVIKRGNKTKVVIGQTRRAHSRPTASHAQASDRRSYWENDEWESAPGHDRASTRSDYHTVADLDLNLAQNLADLDLEPRSRGRSRPGSIAGTPYPRSRASSVYPESVYDTPYTSSRRRYSPPPRRHTSSYYPESVYESSYPPTVADRDDDWRDEDISARARHTVRSRSRPARLSTIERESRGRRLDSRYVNILEGRAGSSERRDSRGRLDNEVHLHSVGSDKRGRVRFSDALLDSYDEAPPSAKRPMYAWLDVRPKDKSSGRRSKHSRPRAEREPDEDQDELDVERHGSSDDSSSSSDDSKNSSADASEKASADDGSQRNKAEDESQKSSSQTSARSSDDSTSLDDGSDPGEKRFRQVRWDISDDDTIASAFEDPFDELDFAKFMKNPSGSDMLDLNVIDANAKPAGPAVVNFDELNIQRSRWIDGSLADDKVVAEVTLTTNSVPRSQQPMKWIHLEREQMVFEEFISVVQQSTQGSRSAPQVLDLLQRIRDENEPQRQYGRDMDPVCLGEFNYDDKGEVQNKMTSSVIFLSIPFMRLEEYSGSKLRSLHPGSPIHPARGIVHAFTNVCDDRRELEQAIHRTEDSSRNCLHKSNLWCLVVNDEWIVTCSRLSLASLMSNHVKTIEHPPSVPLQDVKITLDSRAWKIPRAAVDGWPALLALFSRIALSDLGESGWEFRTDQGPVNARNWSAELDNAAGQDIRLSYKGLESTRASGPNSLYQAVSDRVQRQGQRSTQGTRSDRNNFHKQDDGALGLFQYPSVASGKPLTEWAGLIHDSLLNEGKQAHRRAYFDCPLAAAQDIFAWIGSATKPAEPDNNKDPISVRRQKRQLIKIAVLVVNLCQFFWPPDFEHLMIQKTYGALLKFLKDQCEYNKKPSARAARAEGVDEILGELSRSSLSQVRKMTENFQGHGFYLQDLPHPFVRAWMRLCSAFLLAANIQSNAPVEPTSTRGFAHLNRARGQLERLTQDLELGEVELTTQIRAEDLQTLEVCPARGLAAQIVARVCEGVDIRPRETQAYEEYFQRMNSIITRDPFSRSHRKKLRNFQEELSAMQSILQAQREVVSLLEQSSKQFDEYLEWPDMMPYTRIQPNLRTLSAAKDEIDYRLQSFQALNRRAEDLGVWHLSQIETNKDKQESAIIIFTLVTIVFLPLSFVASVFGMNTNDIRNMDTDQWAFWVSALPLTLIVILISVWSAGLLDVSRQWLASLISPENNPRSRVRSQESRFAHPSSKRSRVRSLLSKRPSRPSSIL